MHLTLHLTARCNFRCGYCYAAPHTGGTMTADTVRAAIDLGLRLSAKESPEQSLGVVFFGGEPLLCPDLIRLAIHHCREVESRTGQRFHFKVTTNGSLLDEEFLTDPLTSEVFVALSHDGVQAAHDMHRLDSEGKGTFERLLPAIERLLKHRPYAPVMLVTTPETVQWYADSVRFLFTRGFRYIICSLNYGRPWSERSLRTLAQQYDALSDWYEKQTEREEKFYFSPFDVKIASHVFTGSCRRERCELGRRQLSVAPDGRIFPCVQFVANGEDSEWCIGDVRSGVDEVKRQRIYEANAMQKEECSECAIRARCNHFCGCLNRQATGRIDAVAPILCAHEQMVLQVADRLAERLFRKKAPMFVQKQYNELFPLVSLAEDHVALSTGKSTHREGQQSTALPPAPRTGASEGAR